jgi:sugar diacid utilization regulator
MRELLTEEEIFLLRLFADHNMKVQPVAEEMHFHRRTIFKKLFVIYKKTGKDPHRLWELVHLIEQIDREEGARGGQ